MTDAHNVFLNFAAQTGLVGLAAMLAIVLHVARRTFPLRLQGFGAVRVMLGLTWLNAFVYQGLTGSYEDARHLWLLLGLLIAAERLETNEAAELRPAAA
jgi:O-antigen ligase